jgi:hypothetical protein
LIFNYFYYFFFVHTKLFIILLNDKLSHQIINGFHFGSLERDLANFGAGSGCRTIDLNLDDFSFDDLSLFADSDTDALPVGSEFV